MEQLFTFDSLFTLLMLVLLQAVLGFDNLLYISLESKKAPVDKQIFIIYTAVKEIWHMMLLKEHETVQEGRKKNSINKIILWIVIMNLVFSFDSILSAMALTNNMSYMPQLILMSIAVIIGGVIMIVLADKVSNFLQKNRMYEVLGLFILFIVGIMLLSEGGHLAHLHLFNNAVTPMSKTTFYFVIIVLVLIDIVQGHYQKKLLKEKEIQENLAKNKNEL